MIRTIVFDCDGVMFDSKPANAAYYNTLLSHFKKPTMTEQELEFVHTHNVHDSVAALFEKHKDVTLEQVHQLRSELDYQAFLPYFVMAPDLLTFLESVKAEYNIAISTNRSDTMELLLEKFHLKDYFGKVMTAANAPRPKPAPDGMYEIFDFYGCSGEETLFIGDSIVDQLHAEASGTYLIAYKNPQLQTPYHITSFMQIHDLEIMTGQQK